MNERSVSFGPDGVLAGVWAEPGRQDANAARHAAIMINSGVIHHVGIWRLHVRLARRLAERGLSSLRFDMSGIGDSGSSGAASLEQMVADDIEAALDYVETKHGRSRVLLFGLCSGAYDAIEAARRDPRIVGIASVDLIADLKDWRYHAKDLARRLGKAQAWKDLLAGRKRILRRLVHRGSSSVARDAHPPTPTLGIRHSMPRAELEEKLAELLSMDTRLLMAFSAGLLYNYNHPSQFRRALPRVAAHPKLSHAYFPRADHTFSDLDHQRQLLDRVTDWMVQSVGESREEPCPTAPAEGTA